MEQRSSIGARGAESIYWISPQDVELFSGPSAENITRFERGPDEAAMIEAAKAPRSTNLFCDCRKDTKTQIGDNGAVLSSGQRSASLSPEPYIAIHSS